MRRLEFLTNTEGPTKEAIPATETAKEITMNRLPKITLAMGIALAAIAILLVPQASASRSSSSGPSSYELIGDDGGSKFEGIGVDRHGRTFFVGEVTGGEIHRGDVRSGETEEWMSEGTDGRFTARGITTDGNDRIYIAGGPNGIDTGRPDLWIYESDGSLLAALRVNEPNAFLNDVTIGPDGAAYFTNSNAPQIFRVTENSGQWEVDTWADASATISQEDGFNLGGIVVSRNNKALVVAQGNVGKLWRFDLQTAVATAIDTGGADLVNADGLVMKGNKLIVVRNFSRALTTLQINSNATQAELRFEVATDADRVFTTAKLARGRLLLIDSHFDEPVAEAPYEVVSMQLSDVFGR